MRVEDIIKLIYADKQLKALKEKIDAGLGTFLDTAAYCNRSAELLGRYFSESVLGMSDVERVVANDTLLRDRYKDINDLLDKAQRATDKRLGISLQPRHAEYNAERADQIGQSLTDKTVSDETIQRRAKSAPANMTRSMQDDFVEENAEFRSKAGLKCYIVRISDGEPCEWCDKLAGRYEYGSEPDDVYHRHDNCGCVVTYENGRQRQNVWTKKTWEEPAEGAGAPEPVRFTKKRALRIENINLSDANQDFDSSFFIKGSSEIRFDALDSSAPIDKKFSEEYRKEYDKFTDVFGELTNLRGVYTAPYKGFNIYGGYNPQSYEITLLGVGGKDGKSNIQQITTLMHKNGEWSTKSVYHTFRHELGHALYKEHELYDVNWSSKLEKIEQFKGTLENELTDLTDDDIIKQKKRKLSIYGFSNTKDFIAESVAEYINNPAKARSTALTVVNIILGKE